MKVKCYICKIVEKEVEIDDKFKALAVEHPWEHNLPDELYDEAIKAVEKAAGAQMNDDCEDNFICGVEDLETNITILEG
jgi:hypothetical protein